MSSAFASRLLGLGLALCAGGCGAAADPPEATPGDPAAATTEASAQNGGPTFDVDEAPPLREGERFAFARKKVVEKKTDELVSGKVRSHRTSTETTSFSGVVEIAKVGEDGQPLSLEYDIAQLVVKADSGTWSLARGTRVSVVRAKDEARATLNVDGRPATDAERGAIGSLVSLGTDDTPDEVLFRTDEPRAVGETWRGREDILRKRLESEGIHVPPDGLSVTAELVRVLRTPDGDEREVACDIQLHGFGLPRLDEGRTTRSSLRSHMTVVLSPDGRPREQRTRRTLEIEVAVDADRALRILEVTSEESRNEEL